MRPLYEDPRGNYWLLDRKGKSLWYMKLLTDGQWSGIIAHISPDEVKTWKQIDYEHP